MAENERREEVADAREVAWDEWDAAGVDGRSTMMARRTGALCCCCSSCRTDRSETEQGSLLVADSGADVWRSQVPQPLCNRNRAYHDVGNGVRFVENRERVLQRCPVFDLGLGDRPG